MGSYESKTDRELTKALEETYPGLAKRYQREQSECPALWTALSEASKKKTKKGNQGIPEATIFREENPLSHPIAIIEGKKKQGIIDAQNEAQWYVREAAKKKQYVPIAIGFDGKHLTIDFYVEHDDEFRPCRKANGESFSDIFGRSGDWPTENELIALGNSSDGQIRGENPGLPDEVYADLFRRINETMHGEGVVKDDRITVFTAFLVACRSTSFVEMIADTRKDKKSPQALATQILANIQEMMGKVEADVGSDVSDDLKGFISFVKPKLSGSNNKATNGSKAISKIVYQDFPHISAKHNIALPDFLGRLNNSLFNIVDVYDAFQTYSTSNDLGQYFTPRHVVRSMIRIVEILRRRILQKDDVVYDPACGVGGVLVGALERVAESKHGDERAKIKKEFGAHLLGCENTDSIAHVARLNLWMHGDGTSGIAQGSSLERDYLPAPGSRGDHGLGDPTPAGHPINQIRAKVSARTKTSGRPTVVLMNPPYPTKKKDYHAFEFVEHALSQMEEGGFLCALVPATTIISDDKLHSSHKVKGSSTAVPGFRARTLKHAQLHAVISMANDLFAPGAAVHTYVIVLSKQAGGHQVNRPVLFARCPDDGYKMAKSVKRRMGPKENDPRLARWNTEIEVGGDLADLIFYRAASANSPAHIGWLHQYLNGNASLPRFLASKCISPVDVETGADWAPERFIDDGFDPQTLLGISNLIYSELQSFDLITAIRRTQGSHGKSQQIRQAAIGDVNALIARIRSVFPNGATVGDLFTFPKVSRFDATAVSETGTVPLVSASEQEANAVLGYVDSPKGSAIAPGNTISVAKNGYRPMFSRFQPDPYCLTGDVASLKPKSIDGKPYSEMEMIILAALIENHVWRFSYGRKASEGRMKELRII